MAPSIVFVPGSFAQPSLYDDLLKPLQSQGHDIHAVDLPTVFPKEGETPDTLTTMYDDAKAIAAKVAELADAGKHIIIAAHSYGGIPATESVRGLSKQARQKEGKPGGVIRLAYLTCLVPDEGQAGGEMLASKTENLIDMKADDKGWLSLPDDDASARVNFSDAPPEVGRVWAAKFVRHSSVSFANKLTYAGYKDVPASWLLCEEDLTLPRDIQQAGIDLIEKKSGNKVDVTPIRAGHCPSVTALEKTKEWMIQLLSL